MRRERVGANAAHREDTTAQRAECCYGYTEEAAEIKKRRPIRLSPLSSLKPSWLILRRRSKPWFRSLIFCFSSVCFCCNTGSVASPSRGEITFLCVSAGTKNQTKRPKRAEKNPNKGQPGHCRQFTFGTRERWGWGEVQKASDGQTNAPESLAPAPLLHPEGAVSSAHRSM